MKLYALPFALVLSAAACSSDTPTPSAPPTSKRSAPTANSADSGVQHVDAKGAKALLDGDDSIEIVDVRTPAEFARGHIHGAVNVDFNGKDFATRVGALAKDGRYLVHCLSGGRSTAALATFEELGFQHVWHLDGGMRGWESAGLPLEK